MALPKQYAWLTTTPELPQTIVQGLALLGTIETPGVKNNPTIVDWAGEVDQSLAKVYKADSIAWCGLLAAVVVKRAKKTVVKDPLWALNWGTFGVFVDQPGLGDVLVFTRRTPDGKKAGHVGFYIGEDKTHYHVLGGNQADCVCIARIPKTQLYQARRPKYVNKPRSVKPYQLASTGTVAKSLA